MTEQGSKLNRLDDLVVPRLQRGAWWTAHGMGWPVRLLWALDDRLLSGRVARGVYRRRTTVAFVTVVLGLAGTAQHLTRYDARQERLAAEAAAAREQTVKVPGAAVGAAQDGPAGVVVHGAPLGSDVDAWIEARHVELDALPDGEHLAIVSFVGYVSAEAAADVLGDARILLAQYRLPDAGEPPLETEVVRSDLEGSVDRVIRDALSLYREEEASLQELLDSGTLGSPEFEADARNRVEELRAIRNVLELTGGVVFAVLIEADTASLWDIAGRDGVRLVDPLPAGADPDAVAVWGLRPEDVDEVSFGAPEGR